MQLYHAAPPQMPQLLREPAVGTQSSCLNWMLISTISHLQRLFREFGSTSALWPHAARNHTSPGPPHPASLPPTSSDQPRGALLRQTVCITQGFLHKLSRTISGKLICMLFILAGVSSHWMAPSTLERCFLHGWTPVLTELGSWWPACKVSCGWAVYWST